VGLESLAMGGGGMFYALDCTRNKLNASGSRMSWLLFCSVFFLNFSGDFWGDPTPPESPPGETLTETATMSFSIDSIYSLENIEIIE
jgi:hypothetical protein